METVLQIKVKQIDPDLPLPRYAHDGDAGCDLLSRQSLTLAPGGRALVPTGIAVAIPGGYAGFVQPRSGLASRHGIGILNSPGLIDSKYRGEVKVVLVNLGDEPFDIGRGDRIAQLVIQRVESVKFEPAIDLDDTHRGDGGFGSTGV